MLGEQEVKNGQCGAIYRLERNACFWSRPGYQCKHFRMYSSDANTSFDAVATPPPTTLMPVTLHHRNTCLKGNLPFHLAMLSRPRPNCPTVPSITQLHNPPLRNQHSPDDRSNHTHLPHRRRHLRSMCLGQVTEERAWRGTRISLQS